MRWDQAFQALLGLYPKDNEKPEFKEGPLGRDQGCIHKDHAVYWGNFLEGGRGGWVLGGIWDLGEPLGGRWPQLGLLAEETYQHGRYL